jgi:hypothetical protein
LYFASGARVIRWCLAVAVIGIFGPGSIRAASADPWAVYNPGLGTIPDSQGWTRIANGDPPEPSVSGGVLLQGPTGVGNRQYWRAKSPSDIDFTTGFTAEFDLKVISSSSTTVGNATKYRAGWEAEFADSYGRCLEIAIGSDTIILNNDGNYTIGPNSVTVPFDSTSGFHHYQLVSNGGLACLFVDGYPTLSIDIGATGSSDPIAGAGFGDESAYVTSQTELGYLRYRASHGYFPALGTMPEEQGWTRNGNGDPPDPTLVDGLFYQGPTGIGNRQHWDQISPIAFDFTTGFSVEFDARVISSGFTLLDGNKYRAGFEVAATDMLGRDLEVGISSSVIMLNTDADYYIGPYTSTALFDPTDGFHHYQIVSSNHLAAFYIDGVLRLFIPIGPTGVDDPVGIVPGSPTGAVSFGDMTAFAQSRTIIANLRYSNEAPLPGSVVLSTPTLVSGRIGQTVVLSATLKRTSDGTPITGATLQFQLGGTSLGSAVTDSLGTASVAYTIRVSTGVGLHTIAVGYSGSGAYDSATATGTLNVTKGIPGFSLFAVRGMAGETVKLRTIMLCGGQPVIGRSVQFLIDGTYACEGVSDANGVIATNTISAALAPGAHSVTATFAGDTEYYAVTRTTTALVVTAGPYLRGFGSFGGIGQTVTLSAALTLPGNNAPVAGESVQFNVGGAVAGTATTGADGTAKINYTIPAGAGAGVRSVTLAHSTSTSCTAATGAGTLTVSKANVAFSLYAASGSVGQTVTLKSLMMSGGKAVIGKTVQFSVDGTPAGAGVSDASGVTCSYTIPASLGAGLHSVTVSFAGDAAYNPASRTTAALTVK